MVNVYTFGGDSYLHLSEVQAWLKAHGWDTQLAELDGMVERQQRSIDDPQPPAT